MEAFVSLQKYLPKYCLLRLYWLSHIQYGICWLKQMFQVLSNKTFAKINVSLGQISFNNAVGMESLILTIRGSVLAYGDHLDILSRQLRGCWQTHAANGSLDFGSKGFHLTVQKGTNGHGEAAGLSCDWASLSSVLLWNHGYAWEICCSPWKRANLFIPILVVISLPLPQVVENETPRERNLTLW